MEEHLQGRAQGSVGKGSIASSVVLPVLGGGWVWRWLKTRKQLLLEALKVICQEMLV